VDRRRFNLLTRQDVAGPWPATSRKFMAENGAVAA